MALDLNKLIKSIKRHEGFRLQVYDDATGRPIKAGYTVVGNPTIGYGRNLAGKGISKKESFQMLSLDIIDALGELDRVLPWWRNLSGSQQEAMAELCFNLGINGLLSFKEMLSALQEGDFATARHELLDSKWARQQVAPERSHYIAGLLEEGTANV